jgi:hypothetical protein
MNNNEKRWAAFEELRDSDFSYEIPGIGRFNSFDPYPGSLNKYAYCHNDPVNFADPTGMIENLAGVMISATISTMIDAMTGIEIFGAINELQLGSAAMTMAANRVQAHDNAAIITPATAGPAIVAT